MTIQIKYSKDIDGDDFLRQVLAIDAVVYPKELQGTFKSVSERYHRNKNSFILAFDNDLIVGYICLFPISKRLLNEMETTNKFFDDNIDPKDVLPYSESNDIFVISVAILPEYQNGLAIMKLCKAFKKFVEEKNAMTYAYAVSEKGEKLSKILGIKLLDSYRYF